MLIEYLDSNNLNKYRDYLDMDASENIGRQFYRGFLVTLHDEPGAGIIWEITSDQEEHKHVLSRIVWMKITDHEAGKQMLHYYSKMIAEDKVEGSFFEIDDNLGDENVRLLEVFGFEVKEGKRSIAEITAADIKDIQHVGSLTYPSYIESLEELETDAFIKGIRDCHENAGREIPPDLFSLPIDWYEQEVSCYHMAEDGCQGFLLFHQSPSKKLTAELLSDWGLDPKSDMMNMIRYCAAQIQNLYSDDTRIIVHEKNNNIRELMSYLFPNVKRSKCIKGVRKEL